LKDETEEIIYKNNKKYNPDYLDFKKE